MILSEIFNYSPNTDVLTSYSIIDIKNAIIGNDKEGKGGMEETLKKVNSKNFLS